MEKRLILHYNPTYGKAVADGLAKSEADRIVRMWELADGDWTEIYSTQNIFNVIRLMIQKGDLPFNRVIFQYNGHEIHINKYGAIHDWPKGFLAFDVDCAQQLIMGGIEMRRQELNRKERETNGK